MTVALRMSEKEHVTACCLVVLLVYLIAADQASRVMAALVMIGYCFRKCKAHALGSIVCVFAIGSVCASVGCTCSIECCSSKLARKKERKKRAI